MKSEYTAKCRDKNENKNNETHRENIKEEKKMDETTINNNSQFKKKKKTTTTKKRRAKPYAHHTRNIVRTRYE